MKIFVGYAREDAAWLETLGLALNELWFVAVMIDKRAHEFQELGEDWRRAIRGLVKQSDVVLLLISRSWEQSAPCRAEFDDAEAIGKFIVPIAIDATFPIESWPKELSRKDACVLTDPTQRRDELDRLRARLKSLRKRIATLWVKRVMIAAAACLVGWLAFNHFPSPSPLPPPDSIPAPWIDPAPRTVDCKDHQSQRSLVRRADIGSLEKLKCLTEHHCTQNSASFEQSSKNEYCALLTLHRMQIYLDQQWSAASQDPFATTVPVDQVAGKVMDPPAFEVHCTEAASVAPWVKFCPETRASRGQANVSESGNRAAHRE